MVDHRRTPSRRAYQLPGWFFALAAVLCVAGLVAVVLSLGGNGKPEPEPRRTIAPSVAETPTVAPTKTSTTEPDSAERPTIAVAVLNATETPGLAAGVADDAKEAGWKVDKVGNWRYGASHNAVYYPEGSQDAAEQLARDLGIDAVEPATDAMRGDVLTVLLVERP